MLCEDPRNRCCCAIKIQIGALIIACIGIFACLCLMLLLLILGRFLFATVPLILAAAYASIFYAHYAKTARLYWPFLVANGIAVAVGSLYLLVLAAMFLLVPHFWQRWLNEFSDFQHQETIMQYPRLVTGCIGAVMLFVQVINIWFELVVYNASTFVQRQHFISQHGAHKV
ncbi:hypothetical protein niasHS_004009 [Heterodera schachtii]|uniref:Uncharacterized protein n=1 Tax=Heterodera schachtii TaxID=97005 RepID=A0ABD2K3T1_HETSC